MVPTSKTAAPPTVIPAPHPRATICSGYARIREYEATRTAAAAANCTYRAPVNHNVDGDEPLPRVA
jgi:hypothetical protein